MVISHGTLSFPEAQRAAGRQLLQGLAAQTRNEPGCLLYSVSENLETPGVFIISEHWASQDAMHTHLALPGVGEAVTAVQGMGVTDLTISSWEAGSETKVM